MPAGALEECDVVAALAGVRPPGAHAQAALGSVFAPPEGVETRTGRPCSSASTRPGSLKPDAGMLLGSPANADPVPPHDVQAEEMDIALGIHHIEDMTTLAIRRRPHLGRLVRADATWWRIRRDQAEGRSSGWPRKAATASRPRPPWAGLRRAGTGQALAAAHRGFRADRKLTRRLADRGWLQRQQSHRSRHFRHSGAAAIHRSGRAMRIWSRPARFAS
ncbi:hypothetical protein ACU4GD_29995 [Cupriavidus basilensis]